MPKGVRFLSSILSGAAILLLVLTGSTANALTPEGRNQKIAVLAVGASMIELPPAWICEIIFAAELLAEALCDPPPCRAVASFDKLFQPKPAAGLIRVDQNALSRMFSGGVDATIVRLYQRAIDLQSSVAADELAVAETVNRRAAANKQENRVAVKLQGHQFQRLVARTMRDKRAANLAWKALLDSAERAKITDKAPLAPDRALDAIRGQGFSAPRIDMMHKLGMTDLDIELVQHMIAESGPIPTTKSFIEVIPAIIKLNERNEDITSCSCRSP